MVTVEFIPSTHVKLRLGMQSMHRLIDRGHGIHRGIFLVRRRGGRRLFVKKRVAFNAAADANTYGARLANLDAAHTREVAIHRSLRPANIFTYADSFLNWASPRAAMLFMDFYPLSCL
jgi:hypothetical protein